MENDCVKDEEDDGANPHDVDRIDDRMNAMLVSFMMMMFLLFILCQENVVILDFRVWSPREDIQLCHT